ncbi:MAG: hypothetical protein RR664_05375 [Clostridia bacterium]
MDILKRRKQFFFYKSNFEVEKTRCKDRAMRKVISKIAVFNANRIKICNLDLMDFIIDKVNANKKVARIRLLFYIV